MGFETPVNGCELALSSTSMSDPGKMPIRNRNSLPLTTTENSYSGATLDKL